LQALKHLFPAMNSKEDSQSFEVPILKPSVFGSFRFVKTFLKYSNEM
jgi:hypothetical protein